jgi:hypothetical protein
MACGTHRREITALFCDLRGFTGSTESADAEDVMALLRDYHAAIGEIINTKFSGPSSAAIGLFLMVVEVIGQLCQLARAPPAQRREIGRRN